MFRTLKIGICALFIAAATQPSDACTLWAVTGPGANGGTIISKNRGHHLRTKVWRAGIDAAHCRFQLTQHTTGCFGIFTHHGQAANAFAVQREDF